jgi:hypothetical protein
MPLFRKNVDFKIDLKDGADPNWVIKHRLIYKINIEELEAVYKYLVKNLNKEFITSSAALFASSILIARHPSIGKLRFCIDFRKLNAITKKD